MKSEQTIREYIAGLQAGAKEPCECTNKEHAKECYEGTLMMAAAVEVLRWVLDENPDHDSCVDHVLGRDRPPERPQDFDGLVSYLRLHPRVEHEGRQYLFTGTNMHKHLFFVDAQTGDEIHTPAGAPCGPARKRVQLGFAAECFWIEAFGVRKVWRYVD